jgi:Protein of unknown function (DUF2778)
MEHFLIMTANTLDERLQKIANRSNNLNTFGKLHDLDNQSLQAIGIPPRRREQESTPAARGTIRGVFDMGTGTLVVTKYDTSGNVVKQITIEPGGAGSKNLGVFSGSGRGMNESEYVRDRDIGPLPLGTYNIHNNSQRNRRDGGPRDDYRQKYGVNGGWYRLELQDNNHTDDRASVRAQRGVLLYERSNVRGHIGFASAGCMTVHPSNKGKWLQIEEMFGMDAPSNEVLGTITVIDSRPGPGNGSLDSASTRNTEVLSTSNRTNKPKVEHTI